MSIDHLISEHVLGHDPYIPGEQPKISNGLIKLNTNENPYPPSPDILKTLSGQIEKLNLYPDSSSVELRNCIAKIHNVDPDQVIVGNGSDDILNLCTRSFSDRTKGVGFFDPSYSLYEVLCSLNGCPTQKIPFSDSTFDIDEDLITGSGTNLFFLTSPHAPTGRTYKNQLFSSILNKYDGILVIDEAYADFASHNALNLLEDSDRLIITRTLSKSYSLAGLRVGYGLSSKKIISILNRVREVYNVDRIAQEIATLTLNDRKYFHQNIKKIINCRDQVLARFEEWGWNTYKSGTNFLFTRPVDKNGNIGRAVASDLFSFLQSEHIHVRYFPQHSLTESYLRISIGKEKEMDMLMDELITWQSIEPVK